MKILEKIDLNRHLIVEVEAQIPSDHQEYLHCSHVKVHDGYKNQLVAEFKRYSLVKTNRETGRKEIQSTFDEMISNDLQMTKKEIDKFYTKSGESHDFVQTYTPK